MTNNVRVIPAGMEDDDEFDFYDPVQKTCQNMKITIVPDITIGAGINNTNFDAKLPEDIQKWFDSYRNMWNIYKKTPSMIETLRTLYLNSDNPLLLALKLFANCPGCSNTKNKTLPILILETVSDIKNEKPDIIEKCDENMKMVAFNFVKTQGLPNLYKIVANAYDLHKDKHLFEEKLRIMISDHNYKDASHWAIILNLTDKFGIFDLILPLILQDKIFLAEEYLDNEKSLQQPTIELLDSFLDKSSSVLNKCDQYIATYNYPDIKFEKLQPKPLTKLIVRLSKKYNLSMDSTPNVAYSKSYGYLQYLIHKKYVEKSLNNDSWRELVLDTIPYLMNSKDMQLELIALISFNYDMNEAVYWAKYFNLSFDELPLLVRDQITNLENQDDQNRSDDDNVVNHQMQELARSSERFQLEESCDDVDSVVKTEHNQQNYHTKRHNQHSQRSHHNHQQQQQHHQQKDKFYRLKLDFNKIILVETSKDFQAMLNELENQPFIAFDSEWKPSFQYQFSISLIQLAKHDKIYLIDAQSKHITDDLWNKLGKDIFNNLEIIKIGFSLNQDLMMCQKAIPTMNISTQIQSCYIDLQELWKKLLHLPDFQFPYKSATSNETLSQLTEICLGKKLDKSNQFSNWGKRPLRKDQIIYAALDAYCLLEIYEVICKQLARMDIDIDHLIDSLNAELKAKSHKTKKKHKSQNRKVQKEEDIPPGPNVQPVRVFDVKFVCDNMLEGLAKSLRKFGIDCLALSCEQREYCVEITIRECRYLLTKGYRYARFAQYLPDGYCYKVQNEYVDDQVAEVLTYFNVIINEEDIFSRCQICNCNEFILATNEHLKSMKIEYENNENLLCDKNFEKNYIEDERKMIPPKRNCIMNKITPKLLRARKTTKGALIQLGGITQNILENVEQFYICEGCGKCYWDGSHWEKVVTGKLKDIIIKN